jgi:hypothetical protein
MATSDCYNGLHDFSHKKWTLRRRLRLIDRFVRIAALHEIQGAVCIGLLSGPDIPPIRPVRSFDYYYALGMVMHTLAGMAMNCAPGERIAFIVDRRDKFTETIESIHLVTPISKHIFGDNKPHEPFLKLEQVQDFIRAIWRGSRQRSSLRLWVTGFFQT